jgi:hypothetical protein
LKLSPHQVSQTGKHYVAAELNRRGADAVTFSKDMPNVDVLASNVDRKRTVGLHVTTKTAGTWQTSIRRGRPRDEVLDETEFWVFVDIGKDPAHPPEFFVAPTWWVENSIFTRHEAHLARHGGQRARSPDSPHHAIPKTVVEEWQDRWDILALFERR